jgi:integrase
VTSRRPHGGGSVHRRDDGSWVGQASFGTHPVTGRRIRRTVTGRTKKEAQQRLDDLLAGGPGPDRSATVAAAVVARLAVLQSRADAGRIKPSTLTYWQHSARHLAQLGARKVASITPRDIVAWQADLDLAPSTKRGAYLFAKQALPERCFEGLETPVARPEREVVPATAEDVTALLEAAEKPWRDIFEVLALTGCRVGEVLALRWTDVGDGVVHVREGKTARARRTIPLLPAAAEAIDRQPQEGELVFPYHRRTISRKFAEASPRPGLTPHSLRHGMATRLLAEGVPMVLVSRILGHASISTTVDLYGHSSTEAEAEAMQKALG